LVQETPQGNLNKSVDPEFGILAFEIIGYDPDNNVLRRVNVTTDGKIKI